MPTGYTFGALDEFLNGRNNLPARWILPKLSAMFKIASFFFPPVHKMLLLQHSTNGKFHSLNSLVRRSLNIPTLSERARAGGKIAEGKGKCPWVENIEQSHGRETKERVLILDPPLFAVTLDNNLRTFLIFTPITSVFIKSLPCIQHSEGKEGY